ncbi:MAG: hypothetical protein ACE37F_18030 [Nannocystaceae bacterium]|nr:hypothetical protein [bacterium]
MLSLALTAALFLADPAASRVDVSGGVSVELRGGRAPVDPASRPEWGILTILTPDVDMEVATRRGTLLNFGYTPRVQYRSANRLDINRPILLHQAYATLAQQLDPRWVLGVNLGGSIGEADYNSAPVVLGADQAQLPDAQVLQIAAASASARLDGRLTRRHTLGFLLDTVYRTPLDQAETTIIVDPDAPTAGDDTNGPGGVPEQLNVEAGVALNTRVTPVDGVEVSVRPGFFDYNQGGTQYATVSGIAEWERQIRPSLSTSVGGGVFYFTGVGETRSESIPVQPVALTSVTGGLVRRASYNVDATLGAGVAPYFNRARISLDSRATLSGNVAINIPPRWTVRVIGAALTNATAEPLPDTGNGNPATETQMRLALPVTYQIDERQQFEFGFLGTVRGPHVQADTFEFNQLETWLYVAYRIGAGTARGGQEVGQSGSGAVTRSARGEAGAAAGGRR